MPGSDAVWLDAHTLQLDGKALQRAGTAARSRDDDVSMPGVVLRVEAGLHQRVRDGELEKN